MKDLATLDRFLYDPKYHVADMMDETSTDNDEE